MHTATALLHADTLLSPALAGFQGPALLAFNDAVFTERDFESISRIGDSAKRGLAGKTGRFGYGGLERGVQEVGVRPSTARVSTALTGPPQLAASLPHPNEPRLFSVGLEDASSPFPG